VNINHDIPDWKSCITWAHLCEGLTGRWPCAGQHGVHTALCCGCQCEPGSDQSGSALLAPSPIRCMTHDGLVTRSGSLSVWISSASPYSCQNNDWRPILAAWLDCLRGADVRYMLCVGWAECGVCTSHDHEHRSVSQHSMSMFMCLNMQLHQ